MAGPCPYVVRTQREGTQSKNNLSTQTEDVLCNLRNPVNPDSKPNVRR